MANFPMYSYNNQQTNTPLINQQNQQFGQMTQQQQLPQSQPVNSFPTQTIFPQPVGSLYNLNTASEIGNIPTGTDLSVGLCLQEGVMYLKTLQNGAPVLLGYKLSPLGESSNSSNNQIEENQNNDNLDIKKIGNILKSYEEKIDKIEREVKNIREKVGGKIEWQI